MSEGLEAIFFLSFSFFLVGSVGDVSTVLLACVLHALGTNPAAVRGFRAAKIVNLHFPLIYIFARIYIPNLRKLKGKCKFYIFPKNVFFRRKIEDFCKNENFHFFLHTKNYYFFSISLVSSLDF